MTLEVPISSLSVIIPAYNDSTTIERLVRDADTLLSKVCPDSEIICINDGSKDNTYSILQSLSKQVPRLKLVNHEVNQGYGRTIKELYLSGTKDVIFSLPGDYQYAPKELLAMSQGLKSHDLVIGLRVKRNDPSRRKMQSHIYNFLLRTLYGIRHKDVNSIKLFKRAILNRIDLKSDTAFVDAELCIRTEKAGFKIVEIPIEHLPRTSQGASGGKPSVIIQTFMDLVTMRPKV